MIGHLRIGAVPYLNAAPLLSGIHADIQLVPSQLMNALLEGRVDLGILSVGAALRHDLRVLPSCGVASDGPVGSVFLLHDGPFSAVRRIRPDPASVSSNLLCRILVERTGSGHWQETAGTDAEGRILIGDAALALTDWSGTDLGEAWKNWTGLPFVFAAWIAGPHVSSDALAEADAELREAAARGMSENGREQLALSQDIVPADRARNYLRNLRHQLDTRCREGMERYAEESARLGIGSGKVHWAC